MPIFRAKGNESFYVIILNAQKLYNSIADISERNLIFTAITRSKGWVTKEMIKKLLNDSKKDPLIIAKDIFNVQSKEELRSLLFGDEEEE